MKNSIHIPKKALPVFLVIFLCWTAFTATGIVTTSQVLRTATEIFNKNDSLAKEIDQEAERNLKLLCENDSLRMQLYMQKLLK